MYTVRNRHTNSIHTALVYSVYTIHYILYMYNTTT